MICSHISKVKLKQEMLLFSENLSEIQTLHLTTISQLTVNKYLTAVRLRILELFLLQSGLLVSQIEVDEKYFGARVRQRKTGSQRSAKGKSIIKGNSSIDSAICSDGQNRYNGIVDFEKHFIVYYSESEFSRGNLHINRIESFQGFAKKQISKV